MYLILDLLFSVFHIILILFNLVGWIWASTRRLHLAVVFITLFSWLGLGYFYGWGYCFLTDWHYEVLYIRGYENLPPSYITFLIGRIFGIEVDDNLVQYLTGWIFGAVLLITVALALTPRRNLKKNV